MGKNVQPLWVTLLVPVLVAITKVIVDELVQRHRSRTRPQYLVCEEQERTPLPIDDRHAALQDILKPAYQGKRLWVTKLKFFNHGEERIEAARITVEFNKGVSILGAPTVDPEYRTDSVRVLSDNMNNDLDNDQNRMVLEIEHLKPIRIYKEAAIGLTFLTTGRVTRVQVSGHGPTWELDHVPMAEAQQVARALTHVHVLELVAGMLLLVASTAISQRVLMSIVPGGLGAAGLSIIYIALRSVFMLRRHPPLVANPRNLYALIGSAVVAAIAMWAYAWVLL